MLGVDLVIPDFTYLEKNKEKIRGMVITHGHEDHIGSVPYFLKKFGTDIPIYGAKLTLGLIDGKLKEHGLAGKAKLMQFMPGDIIKLGAFTVEAIHVNHSIPDSAFAITTPVGVVVHTGDFKVDYTPIEGKMIDLARFAELGKQGVLCMLGESTNAERPGYTDSERNVGRTLRGLFQQAGDRRIIIATFSSNIHRIQQIINLAAENGGRSRFPGGAWSTSYRRRSSWGIKRPAGYPDRRRQHRPLFLRPAGHHHHRQPGGTDVRPVADGVGRAPQNPGQPRRLHHHLGQPHPRQ